MCTCAELHGPNHDAAPKLQNSFGSCRCFVVDPSRKLPGNASPPPPAGLPGLSLPPHPVLALCHVVVASTGAQYCVCGGRPAHVRRTRTAFHQVKHLASLAKAVMRWENQPVSFAAVQGSPPFLNDADQHHYHSEQNAKTDAVFFF